MSTSYVKGLVVHEDKDIAELRCHLTLGENHIVNLDHHDYLALRVGVGHG